MNFLNIFLNFLNGKRNLQFLLILFNNLKQYPITELTFIFWGEIEKNESWIGEHFSSVQFSHSVMSDSLRPHGLHHTGLLVHHQLPELLKLMSIESVMPSNHLILCRPILLLPSIFPSIRVFSNESALPIILFFLAVLYGMRGS